MLDLLLLCHNLLVQQVDLLCWNRIFLVPGLFARGRRLPSNIVQRFFAVGPKFGVFKLPRLYTVIRSLSMGVVGIPLRFSVAYIGTVWGLPILLVILTNFVEIVFIQLADETRKVAVFEMSWEDGFGEFFAL